MLAKYGGAQIDHITDITGQQHQPLKAVDSPRPPETIAEYKQQQCQRCHHQKVSAEDFRPH